MAYIDLSCDVLVYLPVIIPVPPPELIPEFPLCVEDAADMRIQALLSREKRMHGTFGPPKQQNKPELTFPAVFPRSPSAVDRDDTLTYDVASESESGSETLASETQSEASTAMSPARDLVVSTPAPWYGEHKTMTRSETGSQGISLDLSLGEDLRAAALNWIMTVGLILSYVCPCSIPDVVSFVNRSFLPTILTRHTFENLICTLVISTTSSPTTRALDS